MSELAQESKHYEKWTKADPLDQPKLDLAALPKHTPERFEDYIEILNDKSEVVGFKLANGEGKFLLDKFGGYHIAYDPKGGSMRTDATTTRIRSQTDGWSTQRRMEKSLNTSTTLKAFMFQPMPRMMKTMR
jgi:hypothetical protein